jgi:hypothetical protein
MEIQTSILSQLATAPQRQSKESIKELLSELEEAREDVETVLEIHTDGSWTRNRDRRIQASKAHR